MPNESSFRNATRAELAAALQDARHYTLALFDRLRSAGLDEAASVPYLAIINPPLWELGHTAWFAEWFVVREAASSDPASARRPCLLDGGDRWFDSIRVAHATRWKLDLPPTAAIEEYAENVLNRVLERLAQTPDDALALYPFRWALAHEDMHGEAFAYTLQTLGLTAPAILREKPRRERKAASIPPCDMHFEGGTFRLGSSPAGEFIFDNEKPAYPVTLAPFSISSAPVSNKEFQQFILAGGYENTQFWSEPGRAWLAATRRYAPRYWARDGKSWQCERYGRAIALPDDEPVRHVSFYEAQAYCCWAGRRLPSEAEWECAALSGLKEFRWGELWEWTSSPFQPYPGFTADAYLEYSAPWFDTHQVLRGASFATRPRMRSPRYRNFFKAERDDIFVGLRTCAI